MVNLSNIYDNLLLFIRKIYALFDEEFTSFPCIFEILRNFIMFLSLKLNSKVIVNSVKLLRIHISLVAYFGMVFINRKQSVAQEVCACEELNFHEEVS